MKKSSPMVTYNREIVKMNDDMKLSKEYFDEVAITLEVHRKWLKAEQQKALVQFQAAGSGKDTKGLKSAKKLIHELNGRISSFIKEVNKFDKLKEKFKNNQ